MDPETGTDRLAKAARLLLLGAIACVAALIFISPRRDAANPLHVRSAQAEAVSAAPGYLMLTMSIGPTSKLYLNDTNKQVICVYEVVGDKLRLWSARKYDFDSTIFDASIQMPGPLLNGKAPEGGNGITREQAKAYGEFINKQLQDYKAKLKI